MKYRASLLILFTISITGCSGGVTTKTVTVGNKTTVTSSDPAEMERLENEKKLKEEYNQAMANAPRRSEHDPIRVIFVNPNSAKEREKEGVQKLHQALLKEFQGDPIIEVTNVDVKPNRYGQKAHRLAELMEGARGKNGDVYVLAQVGSEDVYGINKKTKKLDSAKAFVYKAKLSSAYEYQEYDVKALGSIFENVRIVKDLAAQIKTTVKSEIGPGLPSRAAVAEINKDFMSRSLKAQTGIEEGDDLKTKLNKLFKTKQ